MTQVSGRYAPTSRVVIGGFNPLYRNRLHAEATQAKNTTTLSFITSLTRFPSLLRAYFIGQYAVYYNDPNLINTRLNKVSAITKEDVQRVANKYLRPTNRTVVVKMPKAKAATASATQ